jgi:hypothetical protein
MLRKTAPFDLTFGAVCFLLAAGEAAQAGSVDFTVTFSGGSNIAPALMAISKVSPFNLSRWREPWRTTPPHGPLSSTIVGAMRSVSMKSSGS